MSTNDHAAEPLTTAELDLLAEVRAARARSPFGLAPESYTLEPASPEMRERYGAARGTVAK